MKIAFYTRTPDPETISALSVRFEAAGIHTAVLSPQSPQSDLEGVDAIVSVGGDGTLLSSVHLIGPSNIPVLGVNFGHLGFLTTANRDNIEALIESLKLGNYNVETRTLLQVDVHPSDPHSALPEVPQFVLNEIYLHRAVSDSLLRVKVFVDGQYLANYSGDGLIVATPTGSTAYSLSCGGPILAPDSGSFVITPIGAHTLTLRPIILPDKSQITLLPDPNHPPLVVGTDSTACTIPGGTEIRLTRAPFAIRLMRLPGQNFFSALRHKLLWGSSKYGGE